MTSSSKQARVVLKNLERSLSQPPAAEVTACLRKRWLLLLPAVFVTYSLAYLDRANYGFGAAAGLAATLHITGSQTALLGSLFFLGYFLFQVPGIAYARRRNVSRLIFYALAGLGNARRAHRRHPQLLAAGHRPPSARRRRKPHLSRDAASAHQLVHARASAPAPTPSSSSATPVTILWMSAITGLPHPLLRLADDLRRRRPALRRSGPSSGSLVVRDSPDKAAWMSTEASAPSQPQLAARAAALPAGRQPPQGPAPHPTSSALQPSTSAGASASTASSSGCPP